MLFSGKPKKKKRDEEAERGNWKGGGTKRKPEGPLKLINGSSCTSSERARCVLRGLKSSSIRQMREQEGGFKWKTNGQQKHTLTHTRTRARTAAKSNQSSGLIRIF